MFFRERIGSTHNFDLHAVARFKFVFGSRVETLDLPFFLLHTPRPDVFKHQAIYRSGPTGSLFCRRRPQYVCSHRKFDDYRHQVPSPPTRTDTSFLDNPPKFRLSKVAFPASAFTTLPPLVSIHLPATWPLPQNQIPSEF